MHRTGSTLFGVLPVAGCAGAAVAPVSGGGAPSARVTGTVSCRERLALLPADVLRANAMAAVIGERIIATDGNQMPFRF